MNRTIKLNENDSERFIVSLADKQESAEGK